MQGGNKYPIVEKNAMKGIPSPQNIRYNGGILSPWLRKNGRRLSLMGKTHTGETLEEPRGGVSKRKRSAVAWQQVV